MIAGCSGSFWSVCHFSHRCWEGSALLWEAFCSVQRDGPCIQAVSVGEDGEEECSFFPDVKEGCSCNHTEVTTWSTSLDLANLENASELKSDFLSSPVSNFFFFSSLILGLMCFSILPPEYSLLKRGRQPPPAFAQCPLLLKLKIFY